MTLSLFPQTLGDTRERARPPSGRARQTIVYTVHSIAPSSFVSPNCTSVHSALHLRGGSSSPLSSPHSSKSVRHTPRDAEQGTRSHCIPPAQARGDLSISMRWLACERSLLACRSVPAVTSRHQNCATVRAFYFSLPLLPQLLGCCLLFVVQVFGVGKCHLCHVAKATQRHLKRGFGAFSCGIPPARRHRLAAIPVQAGRHPPLTHPTHPIPVHAQKTHLSSHICSAAVSSLLYRFLA